MALLFRRIPLFFAMFLFFAPAAEAELPVLGKAPAFKARDMNGEKVSLEGYLGKGPIVVDFWATWCKPCKKELPWLQKLHAKYEERGLQMVTVSIDQPKSSGKVKPYVRGRKYTFPVIMDPTQHVFRKLQGKGSVPYMVIIDADGSIRYRHTGYQPGFEKKLEKMILELLPPEAEPEAEAPDAEVAE
ncbi:MAG: TlpA disulfide reductase family protein [Gemmatimonadota bacterium]|jgi:peroxiredoxin|nr:hypothetical protein [Gemmatimonadota bacterium]MDP6461459.1 TlpA disulfide reductase family protein [Gemmatimonadota bacterium]MDP6529892.1 TlpA disulfide reductase family protein [Gemmatimonadota bacterium]MDP6801719.1 TlpA disulfide reductase family protein [Gemmatimonadota bacterium]MDP7031205.1 TlpA disulfide reductase family protein [Gemmatimonadota bacterium]